MDESAALLTDPDKITFTYEAQLPYLRIAWRELEEALVANGIADVEEKFSLPSTITANTTEWVGQPIDLLVPLYMWERPVGGPLSSYETMEERESDPFEIPVAELENWFFKEGIIKFKGATTDREVILKYQRELITIVGQSTVLPVFGCGSFLSFRNAAILARSRGNRSRADDLDADATTHLGDSISTKVKNEQGTPVRPKPYGWARRGRQRSNR